MHNLQPNTVLPCSLQMVYLQMLGRLHHGYETAAIFSLTVIVSGLDMACLTAAHGSPTIGPCKG